MSKESYQISIRDGEIVEETRNGVSYNEDGASKLDKEAIKALRTVAKISIDNSRIIGRPLPKGYELNLEAWD